MDSQKWLEYARLQAVPVVAGYRAGRDENGAARTAAGAPIRSLHGHHPSRMGDADGLRHGCGDRLVSERRGRRLLQPCKRAYDADTISFIGRMDYYPNQECMREFCSDVCRAPAAPARAQASDRRRGSFAEMRTLGELPGVTVTGSVPDVRPYVRAVGADGRAARHRARHAEQDSRVDGDGCSRGHQPGGCGRRRRRGRAASPGGRHAAEYARRSFACWRTGANATGSAVRGGSAC